MNKVNKKEVPVRAIYLNTALTSPYPDKVLTRISRFVCLCCYCDETVKRRVLLNVCKPTALGWCRGELQTKLHTFCAKAPENIACIFHYVCSLFTDWHSRYIESSRDVFHLNYAVNGRTVMHSFHFSLSSRMFDVFPSFKGKRDSIKIHARKCWEAVRLCVWIVICILSSGWSIVRWFLWVINYVSLKGK